MPEETHRQGIHLAEDPQKQDKCNQFSTTSITSHPAQCVCQDSSIHFGDHSTHATLSWACNNNII